MSNKRNRVKNPHWQEADLGFELGTTEKQIPPVAGWRPWPGTCGLQHQRPKPIGHDASADSFHASSLVLLFII